MRPKPCLPASKPHQPPKAGYHWATSLDRSGSLRAHARGAFINSYRTGPVFLLRFFGQVYTPRHRADHDTNQQQIFAPQVRPSRGHAAKRQGCRVAEKKARIASEMPCQRPGLAAHGAWWMCPLDICIHRDAFRTRRRCRRATRIWVSVRDTTSSR